MAVRAAPQNDYVVRCVPRQDGGWLVVTKKGANGVALSEIPEGARVTIQNGKVERAAS